jgi:hypothetical protein
LLAPFEAWNGGLAGVGARSNLFLRDDRLKAELAILFMGAGIIGILYYGSLFRSHKPPSAA